MTVSTRPKIKPVVDDPVIKKALRNPPKKKVDVQSKPVKIWAVDFDGTLSMGRYPNIGKPNDALFSLLKVAKTRGIKLILWTCRTGQYLDAAVEWCRELGIEFDAVNSNLPEVLRSYGRDPRKIVANAYIDDQAMNPWREESLCRLMEQL